MNAAERNIQKLRHIPTMRMIVGWFLGALMNSGMPKIKIVNTIPVARKIKPQVNIFLSKR